MTSSHINMPPKVTILVLNFNGWEDTIDCLKSIEDFEYQNFNVILIDNGSSNDSCKKLISWMQGNLSSVCHKKIGNSKSIAFERDQFRHKDYFFVESEYNHGFAIGNNIGIKFSEAIGSDLCYLLNNDTVSKPDSLGNLVDFLQNNDKHVAVTPQIRLFDPNDRIWNCGGEIYKFATRKYDYANQHISQVPQDGFKTISLITGCALLFDYKQTGYLSERYFFGEEDFEISLRLRKKKLKMACVYDSIIWHKVGGSIKKDKKWPTGKVFIFYLSRFMNLKDYYSYPSWLINVSIQTCYAITMLVFRNKIGFANAIQLFRSVFRGLKKYSDVDKELFYNAVFEEKFYK